MKTIYVMLLTVLVAINGYDSFAQATVASNAIGFNRYIGFNGAQNLDFRTNNIGRMRLMQTGNSTINGSLVGTSGFLGLSTDPSFFTSGPATPFTLLHLNGDNNLGPAQEGGFRPWMFPGITFTHQQSLMYIGPIKTGSPKADAVILWSDDISQGNDPDVLRFIFATGNGTGSGANSAEGLEHARMTGFGHTGIGTTWTSVYKPKRTLDVILEDIDPQFRITRESNTHIDAGIHADFQMSDNGNLHIVPRTDGIEGCTAIGFFDDPSDLTDPYPGTLLDVGSGLNRMRYLPDESPLSLIIGYEIDGVNSGTSEDKFLGRLDFPIDPTLFLAGDGNWLPAGDKDWETDGTDVWTGHGTGGYPAGKVSVGTGAFGTISKFEVHSTAQTYSIGSVGIRSLVQTSGPLNLVNFGTWSEVTGGASANYGNITYVGGTTDSNFGQFLDVSGTTIESYGARAEVTGATDDYNVSQNAGFYAIVGGGTGTFQNFGLYGETCGAKNNYAVYGKICAPAVNNDWAGFFDGDVFTTGVYSSSDENLKMDVQEISNAMDILNSLNPKSYYYNPEVSELSLSDTHQFGFMAQEVEEVLPELVKNVETPVKTDSLGNVIVESIAFKSIRYNDFIPLLVAAFQEQSAGYAAQAAIIEEQAAQLAEHVAVISELQNQMDMVLQSVQAMQAKTANCCNQAGGGEQGMVMPLDGEAPMKLAQNVPNPFSEVTRIDFELPRAAQVIMEISDAQGRPVEKLIDGQMPQGIHTIQWDGSQLAPGMYFYSLYANGELLTKKMIKR